MYWVWYGLWKVGVASNDSVSWDGDAEYALGDGTDVGLSCGLRFVFGMLPLGWESDVSRSGTRVPVTTIQFRQGCDRYSCVYSKLSILPKS